MAKKSGRTHVLILWSVYLRLKSRALKVSGFTFIRNAITYDFPVVEAITSILPLCDEVVVALGNSEDATQDLIENLDPKIRIIHTTWDDSLREGGRVLAVETDKAFKAISPDSDWGFYIQGDEVVHEGYYDQIRTAMQRWKDDSGVDGLLFNYKHFYGSFDYTGIAQTWYPHEIRVVKNNPAIYSYKDAQGFRIGENKKLRVKAIDAWIYHYGYVKDPKTMLEKVKKFVSLWHDDDAVEHRFGDQEAYDFLSEIDALERFTGNHPRVMAQRIADKNWNFEYDASFNNMSFKKKAKALIERLTGTTIGYKNYKVV